MKKLNHPNLIKLHEVIDDPETEKLYMGIRLYNLYIKINFELIF